MVKSTLAEEYSKNKQLFFWNHIHTKMLQKRLDRLAANLSDKLHPSDVNCARDVTASSVNLMHTPQSGMAPPGATNGSSPEQLALNATRVQGTPDSASSHGSPDTSNGNRHSFHVASAPKKEREDAHKHIQIKFLPK
jgi:hypothetical protein